MFKIHPEIPESMSSEAKAFIVRCFEPDPDRRATALNLLTDEFLTVTSRKKKSKGSFTGEPGSAVRGRDGPSVPTEWLRYVWTSETHRDYQIWPSDKRENLVLRSICGNVILPVC